MPPCGVLNAGGRACVRPVRGLSERSSVARVALAVLAAIVDEPQDQHSTAALERVQGHLGWKEVSRLRATRERDRRALPMPDHALEQLAQLRQLARIIAADEAVLEPLSTGSGTPSRPR